MTQHIETETSNKFKSSTFLSFFKEHPKIKTALIVVVILFLINTLIKLAIGVYFPWNREDWSFLPYTYWNENTELKGGEIISYDGMDKIVVIPRNISSAYAKSGMDGTKVVAIDSWAFGYLSPRQEEAIEVIIVPEGIKAIGSRAFYDCKNLKLLYLPMSIEEIYPSSFLGISDATVITFNPTVLEVLNTIRN